MTQTQPTSRGPSVRESQGPDALGSLEVVPLGTRLDVPVVGCDAGSVRAKAPGTQVAMGESLVDGDAVAVAPADGRVLGVVQATLTNGRHVPAVSIEVLPTIDDNEDAAEQQLSLGVTPLPAAAAPEAHDIAHWTSLMRQGGVWADRMVCPDLLGQFTQLARRSADTVVCNLLDDDAQLRLNAVLVRHAADLIAAAVGRLAKLLSARQPVFAIGQGWSAALRRQLEQAVGQINGRIVALAEHYPQTAPALLLRELFRRPLHSGQSPVEKGVLLLDGAAALSMGECMLHRRAMLRVPLAVHDRVQQRTHYLLATVGMSIREVLNWLGINVDGLGICAGHMLRQIELPADAVIAAAELQLHVMPREPGAICGPCTRCWWCAEHCPMGVEPACIAEAAHQEDPQQAERAGIGWCIECGICSSVCPSQLPLLFAIRKLKNA